MCRCGCISRIRLFRIALNAAQRFEQQLWVSGVEEEGIDLSPFPSSISHPDVLICPVSGI